jgi:hypothetical protein
MHTLSSIADLEAQLNHFNLEKRMAALQELVQAVPPAPPRPVANMHCHTFFSYNAYGHSPTSLAWLGRREGYPLLGIVDFDVLDGVDEFLDACTIAGIGGSAGIETRVFLPEFAEDEMNSPGEPGVLYHMGIGFTTGKVSAGAKAILSELAAQSAERNRALVNRVNNHLDPVTIDYDQDVLPLTPAGNATERHIVAAYVRAASNWYPSQEPRVRFWADRLGEPAEQVERLMADQPLFLNQIRSRLMKRGGVGYVQPDHATFPTVEKLHLLLQECRVLPCAAWLDGATSGEQRMEELLQLLVDKGVVALNIIPDRNWNIANPTERRVKISNLYEVVRLAQAMDLPLNVGTEMNSYGQKLVDDFDAAPLELVRDAFLDGAYFIYGHTTLQRNLNMGYQSDWAKSELPTRQARNDFYSRAGRALPPGAQGLQRLAFLSPHMKPKEILARWGA